MSHFTLSLDPGGGGPLLAVVLSVSEAREQALIAAKQPVPTPVPIRGLLDTGASGTCIDPIVLKHLGLSPTSTILCHTPTTGSNPETKNVYDVRLRIISDVNEPLLDFPALPVMESDLFTAQGIHALIGRDVLEMCLLTYNGRTRQFTLAF